MPLVRNNPTKTEHYLLMRFPGKQEVQEMLGDVEEFLHTLSEIGNLAWGQYPGFLFPTACNGDSIVRIDIPVLYRHSLLST